MSTVEIWTHPSYPKKTRTPRKLKKKLNKRKKDFAIWGGWNVFKSPGISTIEYDNIIGITTP